MGLDCFFRKLVGPGETAPMVDVGDVSLCGGMFSGNGSDGSFRGKVYASLIESISNISLYQEMMMNSDVRQIAEALKRFRDDYPTPVARAIEIARRHNYAPDETEDINKEFDDLITVFDKFGEAGYCLVGWW